LSYAPDLTWWERSAGGRVAGTRQQTLNWPRRTSASAERRIFRLSVVIGGGPDDVTFRLGWDRCGTLTSPDGRFLTWTFLDFAYRAQTWSTPEGIRLIAFGGANSGTITIEPPAHSLPDLPFLVALGCFLTITGHGLTSSE
jgi:hypothetical protein